MKFLKIFLKIAVLPVILLSLLVMGGVRNHGTGDDHYRFSESFFF